MPRSSGYPGRPCDHVDGDFRLGDVAVDAPPGVVGMVGVAVELRRVLDDAGESITAFAGRAGLDRATVGDVLAGRVFIDTHTLARLEAAAGVPLWNGGGGVDSV